MKNYYLYKITNQINSKLYIGITSDLQKRKNRHFSKTGHSAFSLIRLAMDKYGRDNFTFEIICIGEKEYILDLEVKAIALYKTREKKFGYNIKPGGQSGRGYAVNGSKRDVPIFVSGFWFPNRRTAIKSLEITVNVYKNRQKRGTLGDITQDQQINENGVVIKPQSVEARYVGGFWFPSFIVASAALDRPYSTLVARVSKGLIEQIIPENRGGIKGEQNWMFGIDPKDHHSSISVIVEGIEYDSIKQATAATGYSKYIINQRIKSNHSDFSYRGND